MYHIFKATDELKQDLHKFIKTNGTEVYSNSLTMFSNSAYETCLIMYEFIKDLQKDSYGLVTSCGGGHHTLHLYKLSENNRIVLVHSGMNGVITKIEDTDNSFITNIKETLKFFKINWTDYEEHKLKIKNKIIHPQCFVPEICPEQ